MCQSTKYIEYTADDEEPTCRNCDHNGDDFLCDKSCGPVHGWWGYVHSEIIREDD